MHMLPLLFCSSAVSIDLLAAGQSDVTVDGVMGGGSTGTALWTTSLDGVMGGQSTGASTAPLA